jgi:multidrug efflux pump subunit AcrA (membrane-fusion protein)
MKNKWMIFSLIAVVLVFSGVLYYYNTKSSANKGNVIQTSTIGTGNIILSATGLGTLIPGNEVSFGFKQSGQVSEVLATLGEKVQAGQVLARLDSKPLNCNTSKPKEIWQPCHSRRSRLPNRQCRMRRKVSPLLRMICNS